MRKFFLSLGIVAVVAGIIIAAVFSAQAGWSEVATAFGKHDLTAVDSEFEFDAEQNALVNEIDITTDVYAVYVRKVASDSPMSVRYINDADVQIAATIAGNKLTVTEKADKKLSNGFFSFLSGRSGKFFLLIELPERAVGKLCDKLSISVDTGLISLQNIDVESFDLHTDTGAISLQTVSAKFIKSTTSSGAVYLKDVKTVDMQLSADAGAIFAENIIASGNVTAVNETGSVSFKQSEVGGKLTATTDTGSVRFEGKAGEAVFTTATGSVYFEIECGNIFAEVDTGSVRGKVSGIKSEYTISAHTDTGSCNLKNQNGTTDKKLTVRADTGSISVQFAN